MAKSSMCAFFYGIEMKRDISKVMELCSIKESMRLEFFKRSCDDTHAWSLWLAVHDEKSFLFRPMMDLRIVPDVMECI